VQKLFRGLPRGFSQTHKNVFEPRVGLSYAVNEKTIARLGAGVFHNRVTLNDSTLLGGNPPIQLKVGVNQRNGGQPRGHHRAHVPARDDDAGQGLQPSDGVRLQRRRAARADVQHGRGRHLRRPPGAQSPARAQSQSVATGHDTGEPGHQPQRAASVSGLGAIRLSENAGKSTYNGLQISIDRRYNRGLKIGMAYTLSKLEDDASNKRDIMFNAYDPSTYWAISDNDRTHVFNVHYIYELPFWRAGNRLHEKILGGWQVSGVTFFSPASPCRCGAATTGPESGTRRRSRTIW